MNWLTRQQLDEIERQNIAAIEHSIYGPYGFGVPRVVPREPSQVVRQGATWPGASEAILRSEERNRRLTA